MKKLMKSSINITLSLLILLIAVCSSILFFMMYKHDNKYTHGGPQGNNGLLVFPKYAINEYGYTYLIDDWEIYRNRLLEPKDFDDNILIPDEYVFIGQYLGFEKNSPNRNPHGSATYRMNIILPENKDNFTLELPEIYSAYKLYINGELVKQMGNPNKDHYESDTRTFKYTVNGLDKVEILIAVSDYDHFYSGMVYPPTFGLSEIVDKNINTTFGIRFAAIILSLGIGFINLIIYGVFRRNYRNDSILLMYLFILCMFFTIFIAFPVLHSIWSIPISGYALELVSFPAFLLIIIMIQSQLLNLDNILTKMIKSFGVFICICGASLHFLMKNNLDIMLFYSFLLELFILISAIFLFASSLLASSYEHVHSKTMLIGAIILSMSLFMDRFLPIFEPIRYGWFLEISGLIYIVLLNSIFIIEIGNELRYRIKLEEGIKNVSNILDVQKTYYPMLLEKEEELRVNRHDFRHHLSIINELSQLENTEKLRDYIVSISDTVSSSSQVSYCDHFIIDMILRLYATRAQQEDIPFIVKVSIPRELPIKDVDLSIIINNILENAIEASMVIPKKNRSIEVNIFSKINHFGVSVVNVFDGISNYQNGAFLSRKEYGRAGIGLSSVISISKFYNGQAVFYSSDGNLFHSEVLLPLKERIE
ncbi:MAG: GHKL domain-containing protein [Tissierellia bacterium]|nr:GHKL domain-containing protein [Tissierellia bacterium]